MVKIRSAVKPPKRREPLSASDAVYTACTYLLCLFAACVAIYPLVYVFSMSISDPVAVISNRVRLLPQGLSFKAYELVFANSEIWRAYYNTVWYTVVGTAISTALTLMAAYPLSRKQFFLRKQFSFFFSVSLFLSGSLVPMYILINRLGLYNTRWAIVLPVGAAPFYIIIARTFLAGIPESLYESAKIDGADEFTILRKVFVPLSKPIVAVLVIYYAVQQWNSYFTAMIYLPGRKDLQPLQVYLMKILINNENMGGQSMGSAVQSMISLQLKYVVIVVALIPILCVYPFLQRYFIKGMMIGAVKE